MNINEFQSWLNGYLEGIGDTPNKAQWARIKQNIDKLTPGFPTVNVPSFTTTPFTYPQEINPMPTTTTPFFPNTITC